MRSHPASENGPGTADGSFAGQQVRGSRISGQAVPGVCGLAGGRAQVRVDLPCDVALQAADDLGLGLSFFRAAFDVGAGGRVGAHPGEHDPPQGMVGLPVTAGVEPVPGDFPRRRRDGRGGAQVRPGGLAAQPLGVVSRRDEQQRRGVRPDSVEGEQAGGAGGDQRDDGSSRRPSWPSRNSARRPSSRSAIRVA